MKHLSSPALSFRVLIYPCQQNRNFNRMGERGLLLVFDQNVGDVSPCILTTLPTQIDSSYISQNQMSQFGPIEFGLPRKPVLKADFSHERRRNTICSYSCHLADSFPTNVRRFGLLTSEAILSVPLGRRLNVACKYVFQFFLIQRRLQIPFLRRRPCLPFFHWRQNCGSKCILSK